MLTDRLFSARHLPPADQSYTDGLPEDAPYNGDPNNPTVGNVTALFARQGAMRPDRSSILFMFFAQWFTDSILRIDPTDRRKNTSNHNIDLCQIYGLKETTTRQLRSGTGGKLTSQDISGEEYPDYLGDSDTNGNWQVKEKYQYKCECKHKSEEQVIEACEIDHKGLPYTAPQIMKSVFGKWPKDRLKKLYATGLERGNSSVGYVAISIIFLREHNRICDELAARNPAWATDDERLFQTARMINIVLLLKLVVQDYINHIVGGGIVQIRPDIRGKERLVQDTMDSLGI